MEDFKIGELEVQKGATVLLEGSNSPQLFTILEGMGVRQKTLPDGRRQVLNFLFPGDFLGIQAGVMDEMQHSVEASTGMTLCVFDRKAFWRLFAGQPRRAFDLVWLAAIEEHFLGDALASVGQKDAESRVAWALVKIANRCRALGISRGTMCPMPFRQQDLADALGLSLVHTNKTLARLREAQLAVWSGGWLNVLNLDALAETGMAEPGPSRPRPLF